MLSVLPVPFFEDHTHTDPIHTHRYSHTTQIVSYTQRDTCTHTQTDTDSHAFTNSLIHTWIHN